MNVSIVKSLILKDWYLQRWQIGISLLGAAAALAIVIVGGKVGFFLGLISLVSILIGFGANLAVATIVNERKEQTLPFLMSLPITSQEYTTSKILGNLLIFLLPWSLISLGSVALLLIPPASHSGLVPYTAIMSVEMLMSTCLVATIALTTESQRWTVGAIMVCNVGLNAIGYFVAHIGSIAQGMDGASLQWSSAATGLLLGEMAVIALLLGSSFLIQARKRDFL